MNTTQLRRRLLTRYALRISAVQANAEGGFTGAIRAQLAELAGEIDEQAREAFIAVLSHAHSHTHGPFAALEAIAILCRSHIKILGDLKQSGAAVEPSELPKHVFPYPAPPDDPCALKIGMPQAPEMQTTLWLDAVKPEDLEAIAAWLRQHRSRKVT